MDVIGSGVIAVPHVLLHWLATDPEIRGAFTSVAGRSLRPEELEPALRQAFWQGASLTWEGPFCVRRTTSSTSRRRAMATAMGKADACTSLRRSLTTAARPGRSGRSPTSRTGRRASRAGERRDHYGIGTRYREVGRAHTDPAARERAFQELFRQDGRRVRRPVFHHHIFTVDSAAAARLAAMPRTDAERKLREVMSATFRGTAFGRRLQGVYAIH
jgi:hypothetical protein